MMVRLFAQKARPSPASRLRLPSLGPIDARRLWYRADGTNRTYGTDGTYEGIGTPEDGYAPDLFAHPP